MSAPPGTGNDDAAPSGAASVCLREERGRGQARPAARTYRTSWTPTRVFGDQRALPARTVENGGMK